MKKIMTFNYYHGTSSIFLNSIIENGLGGINPNFDFKNLDLLKYLSSRAEKDLMENQNYLNVRDATLAMANQTDLAVPMPNGKTFYFNYRHDGIYVALTREKGAIYACKNKYGSEILEYCIRIFKLIKEKDKFFELPKELNLFKIEQYLDYEQKPILIEINGVKDDELEMENGQMAPEILNNLREIIPKLPKREKFERLQHINFKLLKPVPFERLKFYELEYESSPHFRDLDWTMTRIKPVGNNVYKK
ncbi:hypothetical protein [Cellulophaga sp. Hel_I_12]|uniref:hypothetical protein n=1 Tax=Cellulophaga sp. Hel_I_12 TaxID=1249972 RepID=UPI0012DFE98E|nr:hypothetical protein [Cellulophaga sp. Hel_I_12]